MDCTRSKGWGRVKYLLMTAQGQLATHRRSMSIFGKNVTIKKLPLAASYAIIPP